MIPKALICTYFSLLLLQEVIKLDPLMCSKGWNIKQFTKCFLVHFSNDPTEINYTNTCSTQLLSLSHPFHLEALYFPLLFIPFAQNHYPLTLPFVYLNSSHLAVLCNNSPAGKIPPELFSPIPNSRRSQINPLTTPGSIASWMSPSLHELFPGSCLSFPHSPSTHYSFLIYLQFFYLPLLNKNNSGVTI